MKLSLLFCFALLSATVSPATIIPSDPQYVISLDGTWRFKLEQAKGNYEGKGEKPRVPIDYPGEFEPFYRPEYLEADGWQDLKVPGNWEMAGLSPATYNQPDNASGFYRLWLDIPREWDGRVVKVNFDGVQNGAEIWLNGEPVTVDEPSWSRLNYHEGGWTAFQADLTSKVRFGKRNLLALRVTKNTRSVDLDTGDYFFLGGIHRRVTLFSVNPTHVDDLTIQTRLLAPGKAVVRVLAQITGNDKTWLKVRLGSRTPSLTEVRGRVADTSFEADNVKFWSAEFPNLYDLDIELLDRNKNRIEKITKRVGIREVSIKDGVLLLNGVPIKMAGMCRHDVSPTEGTAVGPALWRKDIELMKAANINAIRTSHYPYGSGFYDLCDELGMYVVDELPYCWTATDNPDMAPAFIQRARETVRRDKNHACVLVWAIGNENKEGQNLQTVADLVKEMDSTRPRAVSWFGGAKYMTELSDSHYTVPDKIAESAKRAKKVGRPHIYLENPNNWEVRLGADPGCWEAWAPVLQRCWDVVAREETLPGTFLWEWQDRAVADLSPTKLYYYFPETGINLLKIKGIVDGFRNPRPWYYDVKMIYSPVRIGTNLTPSADGTASFEVENRYSFTDLGELTTKWQLLAAGKILSMGSTRAQVPPGSKGRVRLKLPAEASQADGLRIEFEHATGGSIVSHRFSLREPEERPMSPELPRGLPFPHFNLITRVTARDPGLWRKVTRSTMKLVNVGFEPSPGGTAWPQLVPELTLDADIENEGEAGKPLGRVHCSFRDNRFDYRIEWNGPKMEVQELGWIFEMPPQYDRFSWERQARWTDYPETHIGRPSGTARPDTMNVPLTRISRPDAFDFNSTKYQCAWASLTDPRGSGLFVRFDPGQRHHCRAGRNGENGFSLTVNRQVSPPDDLSSNVVRDLYLTLKPGNIIEGGFTVGSMK